jgi:hypothetical protein
MPRHIRPRCADTSHKWTQGDTIQTPLGICKRFSATVNRSVTRQPFTRPTQRDVARRYTSCSMVSNAVTRRQAGGSVSRALDRAGFAIIASGLRRCLANPDEPGAVDPAELERLFYSLA